MLGQVGGIWIVEGMEIVDAICADTPVEDDNGQYDYATEILWATGAALMIRAEDYWSVDGLDGRFFAHNEEIDLCWRLRIRGRKLYCLPESYIYHVGGGTLPKSNPMKTFLNFRNNLTMLYKCLPDEELQHVMRWRWFLDYLAAWETLLLKQNWGDFKAIYRARRAFKRWRKDFDACYSKHIRFICLAMTSEYIESNFKEMDFFGELMNGLTEALAYSKEEPLQKPFIRNSSPQKDV